MDLKTKDEKPERFWTSQIPYRNLDENETMPLKFYEK